MNHQLPFFMLTLLLSNAAIAEPITYSNYACSKQVESIFQQWKISEKADWKKQPADASQHSYKIHGEQFAEWFTISSVTPDQSYLEHFFPDGKIVTLTLNSKSCGQQEWVSKTPPKNNSKLDLFTDEDLKDYLAENKNGIIYIWSPNMSLSKIGISNIQAAGKDLGLPVKVLMDPFADQTFAKSVLSELKLPTSAMKRAKSRELASYGATFHFPAAIVFKNGKICENHQNGFRTHEKYRQIITEIYGSCL